MATISINLEFGKTDVEKESKGIQSVHIVFHKIIYLDIFSPPQSKFMAKQL